jgi:hypothetical protein
MAEAKYIGGQRICDLTARERLDEQADALDLVSQKNICTSATAGINYIAWNDGDVIAENVNESYMGAIIDLSGAEYITLNADWIGPSRSFFADADNKRISRVVDSKTSDSGKVYAVPQGAVKAYISQNITATLAPAWASKGVVVFSGREDITTSEYTISNYPYNTVVSHVGVLDSLEIPYSHIKDEQKNLADGIYTGTSGATVSENTATITQAYQGIQTSDLSISNRYIKVAVTPAFNVTKCTVKVRYYVNNAWATSADIAVLVSGKQNDIVIDTSLYAGTKYRLLFQAASITAGITNTITINSLEIYDCTEFGVSPYYNPVFENMMGNVMETLSDVHRVFNIKKDGSGDFTSFVEGINEACKYMDSVVYVGPGTYNILEELGSDYVNSASSTKMGLVLKNRVHVIGSSHTVITMKYTGTAENIRQYLSPINAGLHGFTLENIRIETENVRYSVHDDLGGSGPTPYINKFINCTMIHKNGYYSDCIGGGLGEDACIEIRGCYFEGDLGRNRLVYYHGNNNSQVTDAQSRLTVCDNYFAQDGTFKMTKYGQSPLVSTAYVSNNSFGSAPEVNSGSVAPYDNVAIVAWNNEVRTA